MGVSWEYVQNSQSHKVSQSPPVTHHTHLIPFVVDYKCNPKDLKKNGHTKELVTVSQKFSMKKEQVHSSKEQEQTHYEQSEVQWCWSFTINSKHYWPNRFSMKQIRCEGVCLSRIFESGFLETLLIFDDTFLSLLT